MLAMAVNATILKKINKIIRDFLWHGKSDACGGHSLVNWDRVCRPIELGGFGIRDLWHTGIALRTRWL